MVTLSQHVRKATRRRPKFHWNRTKVLAGSPQKRVVVHRIGVEKPKKPNSAKRSVVRARLLGTDRHLRVKLPGPGTGKLAKFGQVLIRGAHPRDLPGVRYSIIRGKLSSQPNFLRRKARSKHGLRKRHLELHPLPL
jgi:small subunit ribosomal protein S12